MQIGVVIKRSQVLIRRAAENGRSVRGEWALHRGPKNEQFANAITESGRHKPKLVLVPAGWFWMGSECR